MEALPTAVEIAAARALARSASGTGAATIDALSRVLALRVEADDLLERLAVLLAEAC